MPREKQLMVGKHISQHIAERAETYTGPDGQTCLTIGLKAVASIARAEKISSREVEISALKKGVTPWRYLRNIGTIDNDRFTEQNLNRQLLSTEKNLGKYKALEAAKRVAQINSAVTVTTFREKLTKENARRLLRGARVVADGLDNLPSRFAVESACRSLGIPLVHGTIAGFCGQLTTIFPKDAGLYCIYGFSDRFPEQGIEVKIGNPSATPAITAAWQVQEIVKIITGIGKPLRNRLLILDTIEGTADKIDLKK
jgi:molybdopterin/thiamine biosynthesis adenylyltransferase